MKQELQTSGTYSPGWMENYQPWMIDLEGLEQHYLLISLNRNWRVGRWSCMGIIAFPDKRKIGLWMVVSTALPWRHNDHDGVSNHQPQGCLLNRLFRRRSKKTSKLRVTGLCAGKSPGPVKSPHKGPVTQKMFPFDDVIMDIHSWSCYPGTLPCRQMYIACLKIRHRKIKSLRVPDLQMSCCDLT